MRRTVELDNVRLEVRDWPGLAGPLVHVSDPLSPGPLVDSVAALIAPEWRVISVSPRPGVAYQVSATDLLGVLSQFGFEAPVLVGEGLGCVTALVLSAWYSIGVSRLILVNPVWESTQERVEAWALGDCPPDVPALRARVRCHVIEVSTAEQVAATLP